MMEEIRIDGKAADGRKNSLEAEMGELLAMLLEGLSGEQGEDEPAAEGCGEETFLEMLEDLNSMQKIILEADIMMKMACEGGVDPEDARCITYLGVRSARDIMKKWDAYRTSGV